MFTNKNPTLFREASEWVLQIFEIFVVIFYDFFSYHTSGGKTDPISFET